ncbi:MAG: hypothetical protein VKJ04_04265 [Vampirovibrionales bacterium]|nr:hypothetical protein [Vampirovibrionales bacterium]
MKKLFLLSLIALSCLFAACAEPEVEYIENTRYVYDYQPSEFAHRVGDYWLDNGLLTSHEGGNTYIGTLEHIKASSNKQETIVEIVAETRPGWFEMGYMKMNQSIIDGFSSNYLSSEDLQARTSGIHCAGHAPGAWTIDRPAVESEVMISDLGRDARRVTYLLWFDDEMYPLMGQFDIFPARN